MDTRVPPPAYEHLISVAMRGAPCACGCRGKASRFMRCRRGACLVARCGSSGVDMERARGAHEALCTGAK